MSKRHDQVPVQEVQPRQPGTDPAEQTPPVSSGIIWIFWGGVLTALLAARALDVMLPTVPERVIERWVMLPFAGFLAIFLIKTK